MDSPPPTSRPDAPAWSRALGALLHPRACVALLIAATFVARADVLATPIGRVRPTLTAMMTRNLSRDLDEIGLRALFYPRVDYAGDQPGYLLQEFPLVYLAGVALEKGFDLPWETAYRLPSLILFAAMLAFLYAFVRRRFGTPEALATLLLASYFPLAVHASVEVLPEQGVATAFAAGLYFFDRHLDRGERRPLVAAAICFALMLLVKSTSGLLFLAPAGLHHLRRGSPRGLLAPRYLVAAAACALPLVVWLVHAWRVNPTSLVDDGRTMAELIDNYLNQKERWTQLAAAKTYTGIWEMLGEAYEAPWVLAFLAGTALSLLGLAPGRALLAYWTVSLLLFLVLLPFNTATHWYYTHGYVPLFALGAAVALGALLRSALKLVPEPGRAPVQVLATAAALLFVLQARWRYVPPYDPAKHAFGLGLQGVLPPRALGIISSEATGPWDGEVFWASDTRGWRASTRRGMGRRPLSEEFIEEKRLRGATFLAHLGPTEVLAERIPEWVERRTAANAVLASGQGWIVFSLE